MDLQTKSQMAQADGKKHDNPNHAGPTCHRKRREQATYELEEWQSKERETTRENST